MSVFQTILNLGKINTYRKSLKLPLPLMCKCASIRKSSDIRKKFVSFEDLVEQRRAEAKRSIVVQVNSEKSFSELHGYCSKYASIKGMHHYKNAAEEHFILIEFSTEENRKDVIRACGSHRKNLEVMALESPFLWFRASPDKHKKYSPPDGVSLFTENAAMVVDDDALYESLMNCSTVSEQIQMLYDKTVLNDLGVRLRYLVARQVECLFESMYSNIAVQPFGSTVNGFGKLGCDLDLVLTNIVTDEMSGECRRLVFQEKVSAAGGGGTGRAWARHVELGAAALELRAPGAARVHRVPHARVPIVQCTHHYADLDVDLCYNNMSGVHMSQLLWSLGELDERVRPLVFAVRRWAQTVSLTNPNPGRWISNFPLSLLVLHFLQQKTPGGAILPPANTLMQKTGSCDARTGEESVEYTFVRGPAPTERARSAADLETTLLQFFEYYAQFDFKEKAISVLEGVAVRKPNAQPLYIVNPLEPILNVSRNVSHEECERLRAEVRNAAWQLEGAAEGAGTGEGARGEGWGALWLLEGAGAGAGAGGGGAVRRLLRAGNAHRLISVKDLFNEQDEPTDRPSESVADKLPQLKQKSGSNLDRAVEMKMQQGGAKYKKEPLKFKNSQSASEVFRIRRNKIV